MRKFYVDCNRPSYLPDYDPNDYETMRAAISGALDVIEYLNHDNALDDSEAKDALITAQNAGNDALGDFYLYNKDNRAVWCVFIFDEYVDDEEE